MTSDTEKTIAVLITCFNRRETTLSGLGTLFAQDLPAGHKLRVLLTDDGSSDGTTDAVRSAFPEVEILKGDGSLYWVGGMQVAWRAAKPADYYLWFNDDVDLFPGALRKLFDVHHSSNDPRAIVVGATCDPVTGKTCTGGIRRASWYNARVMDPTDDVQECDTLNGNIVLIPRGTEEILGTLDDRYTHIFGDADYGLRAAKHGVPLLLAPSHLGTCKLNSLRDTTFDPSLSAFERWGKHFGPKGHRPPAPWWAFVSTHAPRPKVWYWAAPYVAFWVETLFGGKVRLRHRLKAATEMTLS